jgi:hypothetical protein
MDTNELNCATSKNLVAVLDAVRDVPLTNLITHNYYVAEYESSHLLGGGEG